MNKEWILKELTGTLQFFKNTIECLGDEHSGYKATEESLTVAQQIAHVGQTINWFFDGAFSEKGFDLDFEKHWTDIDHIKTVTDAKVLLEKSFADAVELVKSKDDSVWSEPLAAGPIMGGEPRIGIVTGIIDHSAHHRGALAVYARLQGLSPKMPYAEV